MRDGDPPTLDSETRRVLGHISGMEGPGGCGPGPGSSQLVRWRFNRSRHVPTVTQPVTPVIPRNRDDRLSRRNR